MREWARRNDHAIEAYFWIAQSVPAWYFGWIDKPRYISFLSIYALVKACWAAHHSKKGRKEEINAG